MSQTQILSMLQQCEAKLLRAKKELEELPEAKKIMDCRAKRKEIKSKQDQIVEMSDDAEAKLAKLQAEEEKTIAKINELQEKLDSTSDYRATASLTRDMDGQVKRQGSIAEQIDEVLERQIKIDKLADQVSDMLQKLDHEEHELTKSFKEKGGALKEAIEGLDAETDTLVAQLEPALARRYTQLRKEKNGMGVSHLEEGYCSICRAVILEGQLMKLQRGPAVAECPSCHRIMVVRDEE